MADGCRTGPGAADTGSLTAAAWLTGPASLPATHRPTTAQVRLLEAEGRDPALRLRAANLLGLLVRHASAISPALAAAGACEALAAAARQREDPALQRRAAAALGELLFYADSQQREAAGQGGASAAWDLPADAVQRLAALLEPGQDEVAQVGDAPALRMHASCTQTRPALLASRRPRPRVRCRTTPTNLAAPATRRQHYAAKALENVFGLGGPWAQRLAGPEVMAHLAQVWGGWRVLLIWWAAGAQRSARSSRSCQTLKPGLCLAPRRCSPQPPRHRPATRSLHSWWSRARPTCCEAPLPRRCAACCAAAPPAWARCWRAAAAWSCWPRVGGYLLW